jgi:hypothetical protein
MQLMPTVFMLTRKKLDMTTEKPLVRDGKRDLENSLRLGKLCLLAVVQALISHQYHLCYVLQKCCWIQYLS